MEEEEEDDDDDDHSLQSPGLEAARVNCIGPRHCQAGRSPIVSTPICIAITLLARGSWPPFRRSGLVLRALPIQYCPCGSRRAHLFLDVYYICIIYMYILV